MRVWVTIGVILIGCVVAAVALGPTIVDRVRKSMPQAEPTIVRLEAPVVGDLVERIQAPGEIEPKTKVEISARVSARITELPFEEGDEVREGDVVVQLDSVDYEASLKAARARRAADAAAIEVAKVRIKGQESAIDGTQASLREAELDLERQTSLLSTRDVSQSVVDAAKTRVDQLRSQLEQQEAALEADRLNLEVMQHLLEVADAEIARAEDQLSYTTIRAPIDGVLTRLNAEVGEVVITGTMNNAGTIILEIADLSEMLLVAQVDEADVGDLAVGQRAIVRINAYPDREFEGEVRFISLTEDRAMDGSKYYRTEILIDTNGERIYSGLTADVEIETRRHAGIIKAPSQSVLARKVDDLPLEARQFNENVDMSKSFATVVYRAEGGKAIVTPVRIGASDLTHTVILAGLEPDAQIITGPFKVLDKLEHNLDVKDERVAAEEKKAEAVDEVASDGAPATAEADAESAATGG